MTKLQISIRDGEESRLEAASLFEAVYPPEVLATVPWRDIQSARSEKRILVHDGDCLVATAGLIRREGLYDGQSATICGIGGVATLPSRQRMGFGRAAMLEAGKVGASMFAADFGLLFCEPKNLAFYARLEWTPFEGIVLADQLGQRLVYDIMVPMVRSMRATGPIDGTIDILGLPW